eukprot:6177087-Pleurochrysis_carterae.AAC.1
MSYCMTPALSEPLCCYGSLLSQLRFRLREYFHQTKHMQLAQVGRTQSGMSRPSCGIQARLLAVSLLCECCFALSASHWIRSTQRLFILASSLTCPLPFCCCFDPALAKVLRTSLFRMHVAKYDVRALLFSGSPCRLRASTRARMCAVSDEPAVDDVADAPSASVVPLPRGHPLA